MSDDLHLSAMPKVQRLVEKARSDGYTVIISKQIINNEPGYYKGRTIFLGDNYLKGENPKFPEDRMVVVFLHEMGHVKFQQSPYEPNELKSNRAADELAAFMYSLNESNRMADEGDHGPLMMAVHYITKRAQSGRQLPAYQQALDTLMGAPLWSESVARVERLKLQGVPDITEPQGWDWPRM